ncbi:MAG: XRE family transcriptional regulator [Gammaproteobacteria bacterium]
MSNARPGAALKSLRKSNRWTLLDVSNRTGIPPSTLSRIENDQISPTYDLLLKLSKGLSIDLSQLLSMASRTPGEGSDQPGRRSVNRSGDGQAIDMLNHTVRYLSNDLLKKQITPLLCEYRARSLEEFGEFMRHEGEEFLYVIDGELELHTECYAPLLLRAGESIYFDSRMGHAYISRGEVPCHALSVCTVPQPVDMKQLTSGKVSEPLASEKAVRTDKRRTEVSGRRTASARRKTRRSA